MQDRFKFRIWDNVTNKMIHLPRHFNAIMVNGTVCIVESFQNMNGFYKKKVSKEFDDAVLMQCIDLKDKNDKVIYEGDICKDKLGNLFEVYFDNRYCCFFLRNKNKEIMAFYPGIELEIMGNIYENMELLQ